MKIGYVVFTTLLAGLLPATAQAEDPNDPEMRSAAARARDRELIRRLNRDELARVHQRDARMFAAYHGERATRSSRHQQELAEYTRSRLQYERDMAAWRRAVAACRAGDYSACSD